ncbi:HNH endonuclease [Moritella viscosa]|uniref:HNH endonuclease n=1 Tax=Moritella viscosa TaxID=80854 RepID=UPI00091111DC|nr:HNH endonuclease [Moritella viscosa]SHO14542.1 Putative uncharacterized protein [Moritella viscosa]SHO15618.1 Putative uncharacterized protein [Moritella viscosa]SHO19065.1 Putative uncharacterized protein [Moritella viscosa]
MRPVERPGYTGTVYLTYKSYLPSLITTFGQYCSYCERMEKLDVEHVAPASKNAGLILSWDNFLLGCARCNRDFKKAKNDNRLGYVWPDKQNTFQLLDYLHDGRVKPSLPETSALFTDVKNLVDLVRLDDGAEIQKPLNLGRRTAFKIANRAKKSYADGYSTIADIVDQATSGYWSVWVTVFSEHPDVINAINNSGAYPNTAFDR